jgi:superfamily II helicase
VIAEKARFRHDRKLERIVGFHIPDQAFHGATLEAISSHLNFDRLDHTLHDQLVRFVHTFLRCNCRDSPLCGCPERKFSREILELRENGLDHRQISQYLLEEYGIEIYPADILSFLEESVMFSRQSPTSPGSRISPTSLVQHRTISRNTSGKITKKKILFPLRVSS